MDYQKSRIYNRRIDIYFKKIKIKQFIYLGSNSNKKLDNIFKKLWFIGKKK
jgi:hypothetical protein